MSDVSAGGGVEVGAAEVVIGADTSQAETKVSTLMSRIMDIGNRMTGGAQSGFIAFGTAASGAISGVTSKISTLSLAMGPTSPLAGTVGPLMAISTGFDHIKQKEQEAEAAGRNFVGLTPLLQGMGIALIGAGAAATAFGAPLQNANAALETSIRNTGDGSKGMADFSSAIAGADAQGKNYGYTMADVNQALSQLTAETRDPNEALKELTMTETLAAATHTNLGSAARMMGQIHAGMYRSLRQFGIQLPQIRNDIAKLAGEEQKLADAGQKVTEAHDRLATYQTELNQKMQADQEKYSQAVQNDQEKLQVAQEDLATKRAVVQEQDVQRQQDLANAVADSAQRQADAEQNLADLRDRLSKTGSQYIDNQMSMADAEERVNAARVKVATTSGVAQQSAIEELRKANEDMIKEKLRQSDQAKADQRSLNQAQLQVTTTTQAHTKALQNQSDFAITAAQHQSALEKANLAVSTANQKLIKDQAALAAAQQPTVAQAAKLEALQDAVTKATEAQATAQQKVNDIKGQQARLDAGFQEAQKQFMDREAGLLDRRANTWAGHVRKIKASIGDLLQESGKLAPALFMIGGASATIGTLGQMGKGIAGGVTGISQKIGAKIASKGEGSSLLDMVGEGAFGGGSKSMENTAGEAEKAEGRVGRAFSSILDHTKNLASAEGPIASFGSKIGGMGTKVVDIGKGIVGAVPGIVSAGAAMATAGWTAIAPWLPWIALGAALVAAGWLIYQNWDTIVGFLKGVWNDMWSAGATVFNGIRDLIGGVVDWVVDHWKLLVALFVPGAAIFIGIDWLATHWSEVWDGIKTVAADAWNFVIGILEDIVKGFTKTIDGILQAGTHLPSFLGGDLFKDAKKGVNDASQGIIDILDSLKVNAGSKATQTGQAIAGGLAQGIADGRVSVNQAGQGIVNSAQTSMTTHARISSPSKLFAERIGRPIAEGVAMGMDTHARQVAAAGKRMVNVDFNRTVPFTPISTTDGGGSTRPPAQGGNESGQGPGRGKVVHLEPHFHQEISPLHVAEELAWDAFH